MLSFVIQRTDRRAAADLVVRGPNKETTVIGPGGAQSFALEAGQSIKLVLREATAPAADNAATSTKDSA